MVVERFAVFLAPLDPAVGAEMRKTRPCVVISPDEMNRTVRTVIIAPMTSSRRKYPFRLDCHFAGREGQIALDQLRAYDRIRFIRPLGKLDAQTRARLLRMLAKLFQ